MMNVQFGLMNLGDFDRAAAKAGVKGVKIRDNITGKTYTVNHTMKAELFDHDAPYPVRFMYNDMERPALPDDVMQWTKDQMMASTDWFNNYEWVTDYYHTRFVDGAETQWETLHEKLRMEHYTLERPEREALQEALDDCIEVPQLDLIG